MTYAPHTFYNRTDDTPAYYDDPDAAPNVRRAATALTAQLQGLEWAAPHLDVTKRETRDALRKNVAGIIKALDEMEEYDDETIRLTLTQTRASV